MFDEKTKELVAERNEQLNTNIDNLLDIICKANYKWVKEHFDKNKQNESNSIPMEVRFPFSVYAKIDKKILNSLINICYELDKNITYQKQNLLGREHAIDWLRIRVVTNFDRKQIEIWIQCEVEEIKNLIVKRVEEKYGATSKKIKFWTICKVDLSKFI